MALKELERRTRRIGKDAYAVTRIYSVPNSELNGYESSMWYSIPPGYSGRSTPYPIDISTRENFYGADKRGQLIVQYRTLTNREYMERFAPRGVLLTNTAIQARKANAYYNNVMIQGIDPDDPTGQTIWKIIRGTGLIYETTATFIVRACVSPYSTYVENMADKLGGVNSNTMWDFGSLSQPRHLCFTGMVTRPSQFDNSLTWVDYIFLGRRVAWRPSGSTPSTSSEWETIGQKFEVATQEVPKYDADGEDTGEKSIIKLWRPADPVNWSCGPVFDLTNFGLIENLVGNW